MEEITDKDRARILRKLGYVTFPEREDLNKLVKSMSPTQLVNWAIRNRYVPAYWKEKTRRSEVTEDNGLVFVKPGDRDRVDQLIKDRN